MARHPVEIDYDESEDRFRAECTYCCSACSSPHEHAVLDWADKHERTAPIQDEVL